VRAQSFSDWKEARRFRALELAQEGWSQQDIAEVLDVSKGAVSQWLSAAEASGPAALLARPHTGAPCRLSPTQQQHLLELLDQGAEAYGFRGALWTCGRVRLVIEEQFGVRYHKAHVSRLLQGLHWTPQKPVRRALQQDPVAVQTWRTQTWPDLKKGPRSRAKSQSSLMKPGRASCRRSPGPTPRAG
jgi:transposase